MAVHTQEIVRLPDGLPLDFTAFDINTDDGSFCWSFSATGPVSLLDDLAPDEGVPTTIRITLDGMSWHFAVEGMHFSRAFGKPAAQVSGRSVTALLGDPYTSPTAWGNPLAATAAQLAGRALDFSDVVLDWGGADWLVPAGAWSFQGTPLAAVNRIAEAAGAILQSHRSAATLLVRPRYPTPPWQWAAAVPDVRLPLAAVVRDGWERADRPAWNGVWITGESQGIRAHVKRTGTAGTVLAPQITEPLNTHADAARQRGVAILGAAGPQITSSLDLPVLAGAGEPGVLSVGQLVEVIEPSAPWRGQVRAVSVRSQFPRVRQTIKLERHL